MILQAGQQSAAITCVDFRRAAVFHTGTRIPRAAALRCNGRSRTVQTNALFGRKKAEPDEEEEPEEQSSGGGFLGFGKRQQGTQIVGGPGRPGTQIIGGPGGGRPGTQIVGGTQRKGGFLGFGGRRDAKTVFVAGGTGRLGARIVRELLMKGLNVRAGVRNVQKAQGFLNTASQYGILPGNASRRIKLVEYDLSDEQSVANAIGNAGRVVQAIGAPESDLFGLVTGATPRKVEGDGAINIVNASKQLGVQQYIMVTSMGTGKTGFPASLLNLFGGVLSQKRRAEKALEESGIAYTIVRPGGMERPPDTYKRTHNVVLAPRDTWFGGLVSRLQVAELVATAATNAGLAENKVLEVQAQTEAPLLDYETLLSNHPGDGEVAEPQAAAAPPQPRRRLQEEAQEQQATARRPSPPKPSVPKPLAKAAKAVEEAAPKQVKEALEPPQAKKRSAPPAPSRPAAKAPAEAAAPAVPKPKPQAKAGQSEEAKAREEFKRRADRNAAELAERRAKAARSSADAERRAVQTAQGEADASAQARAQQREKQLAARNDAQAKAAPKPAAPAPQAKKAEPKKAEPVKAAASTGNGKAASPQSAALQNGKPASSGETSTPAEIKERKQEVQGWIKDWRKRT
ncbi:hypothetical protein WJX73_009116 [Symbiochloris irregularis]|uniref:NAD(P)-binding domain-containing protein n=1 Tax=Symbiochloris irregularis TaxID=706552 RepID=A0AAW1NRS2_9CHLO